MKFVRKDDIMDKKVAKFFKKDEYLKQVIEEGKDVYAAAASRMFGCSYEDCTEIKNEKPNPAGKQRRAIAKKILLAMYFSTDKNLHKAAFEMIDCFEFNGYQLEVKK